MLPIHMNSIDRLWSIACVFKTTSFISLHITQTTRKNLQTPETTMKILWQTCVPWHLENIASESSNGVVLLRAFHWSLIPSSLYQAADSTRVTPRCLCSWSSRRAVVFGIMLVLPNVSWVCRTPRGARRRFDHFWLRFILKMPGVFIAKEVEE